MWNRVKKMAGMSKVATEKMTIDTGSELIDKHKDLASFMNAFFKTKVQKLQETLTLNVEVALRYAKEYIEPLGDIKEMEFKTVGTGRINKIISNLKSKKYASRNSQKHSCKSAILPDSFSVAEALEERAGLQDLLGDQVARGLVQGRQVL